MSDFWQQQQQQELEERTRDVIRHALELGLTEDEARLLCYQTGIAYRFIDAVGSAGCKASVETIHRST